MKQLMILTCKELFIFICKRALEKDEDRSVLENGGNINKDLETAVIYDGLGCCYHAKGDYGEVIRYFNKAIKLDPKNPSFLMNRAQAYFDFKKNEV